MPRHQFLLKLLKRRFSTTTAFSSSTSFQYHHLFLRRVKAKTRGKQNMKWYTKEHEKPMFQHTQRSEIWVIISHVQVSNYFFFSCFSLSHSLRFARILHVYGGRSVIYNWWMKFHPANQLTINIRFHWQHNR